MELTMLHLYPDCMSLYGEYANITILARRLEALGAAVTVTEREGGPLFELKIAWQEEAEGIG